MSCIETSIEYSVLTHLLLGLPVLSTIQEYLLAFTLSLVVWK